MGLTTDAGQEPDLGRPRTPWPTEATPLERRTAAANGTGWSIYAVVSHMPGQPPTALLRATTRGWAQVALARVDDPDAASVAAKVKAMIDAAGAEAKTYAIELERNLAGKGIKGRLGRWMGAAEAAGCRVTNPVATALPALPTMLWPSEGALEAYGHRIARTSSRPTAATEATTTVDAIAMAMVVRSHLTAALERSDRILSWGAVAGARRLLRMMGDATTCQDRGRVGSVIAIIEVTAGGAELMAAARETADDEAVVDRVMATAPCLLECDRDPGDFDGDADEAIDDAIARAPATGDDLAATDGQAVAMRILAYAVSGLRLEERLMVLTTADAMRRLHSAWAGVATPPAAGHSIPMALTQDGAEIAMRCLEASAVGRLLIQAQARTRTTEAMADYLGEHWRRSQARTVD